MNCIFSLDPSAEYKNYVIKGCQHKYPETLLVMTTNKCFEKCVYCFRKRVVHLEDKTEIVKDYNKVFDYIKKHHEITNVLLSGGDPLILPLEQLEDIIVKMPKGIKIRIGTRAITYKPAIFRERKLLSLLKCYNVDIITHICTIDELDTESRRAIHNLRNYGVIMRNQAVLLCTINDKIETLVDLFRGLVRLGIFPYYIFQCRPTTGNEKYSIPILQGIRLINETRKHLSGLAKSFRYIASTKTGKLELVGLWKGHIVYRYHQARNQENINKIKVIQLNGNKTWIR